MRNIKKYTLRQNNNLLIIRNRNEYQLLDITDEMYNTLRQCSSLTNKISLAKGVGYYNELYIGIFIFILSASIVIVIKFKTSLSILCPTLILLALFSLKTTVVRLEFNLPNNNEEVNLLIEWYDKWDKNLK